MKLLVQHSTDKAQLVLIHRCPVERFLELAKRYHPDSDVPFLTYYEMIAGNGPRLSYYHRKLLKIRFWKYYSETKFFLL